MLDPSYIVGLIDGEGSFTVHVSRKDSQRNGKKRRARIEPKFYVKLAEEDKEILYQLKQYFNCGNVYLQKDRRSGHKDCYRYEVTNRKELINKIIPFFQKNKNRLRSKKRDFETFVQIVDAIIEKSTYLITV